MSPSTPDPALWSPGAVAIVRARAEGARLIAARDPLLAQVRLGVEAVRDAAVDAWCDAVNVARRALVEEVRGG